MRRKKENESFYSRKKKKKDIENCMSLCFLFLLNFIIKKKLDIFAIFIYIPKSDVQLFVFFCFSC